MNKSKMNSLIKVGRKACQHAKNKKASQYETACAVSDAIEERFAELWPDLAAEDEKNGTCNNMLNLPEYQEAVLALSKLGVPTHEYQDAGLY